MTQSNIVTAVANVYEWIDAQLANRSEMCGACGNCCDFAAYDHRLFITSPEIIYFKEVMANDLRRMDDGVCPYRIDNMCSVHGHRFAGCRIFNCKGSSDFQGEICEQALNKLKAICQEFDIEYSYVELSKGLNELAT